MTLEEAIRIVIPTPPGACRLIRMRLESERFQLKQRIEQKRDLHLVPKKTLEEIEKLFGELK
ncbi:hypothetical protein ACQKLP_21820 [Chitinophaga sp. NPDC101104]|uniref:hypothetical protein n=1 Tax=Chitinophaga sp. NPDC101104 TaxID=3390561 RepID=UPI003D012F1F